MLEKNTNMNQFDPRLEYYQNHINLNQIQKNHFKFSIKNLKINECIIVMDFKQIFKIFGGPVEVSQSFYNKFSVSYLGFMMIIKDSRNIRKKYYEFLSEVITHDSFFC